MGEQKERASSGTTKEQMEYEPAAPKGTVIPADQEQYIPNLRGGAATLDDLVVVQEDVWQEYYQEGSKRASYRLVAAAGSVISKSHLKTLGVKVKSGDQDDTAVHEYPAGAPGQTDAVNNPEGMISGHGDKKSSKK